LTATAWQGLDPCVHCGFCLTACPTYEVTADEADSPRGRIVLMRALARGEMPPDDAGLQSHLDRCLGCRACESVCPSGVVYGPALEAARGRIADVRPLPLPVRVMLWILARPERQRWLWALARLLRATGVPAWLARGAGDDAPAAARAMAMLAATRPASPVRNGAGARTPAPPTRGTEDAGRGERTTLFRGCVMDGLFGHVHAATILALQANGCAVRETPGQVCCGALAAHAGAHAQAAALARENVRAFAGFDGPIVVNSAGCGAMLRSYGDLLAGDPMETQARQVASRVFDVSEVLAARGPRTGHALDGTVRVAYDAPCHLLHAQKVAGPPLQLLDAVAGIARVSLEGSERCCGSAGLYSLLEPALSADVLRVKLDAVRRAAPAFVATGNPGCLMQIGAGLLLHDLRAGVCHPVEVLAWSYRD